MGCNWHASHYFSLFFVYVGKTTVAKMYAEILGKLGLLSKGEVVMKTASDFVGDVIGSSEKTTRDILRSADGCVLVIDEAYGLCPQSGADPYRTAVLDTIVEQVQAKPGVVMQRERNRECSILNFWC